MIKNLKEKIKPVFFVCILTLILFAVYFLTYNVAEQKAYDFMYRNVLAQKLSFDHKKQLYGNDNVVLVIIDEYTVDRYRWPWKRDKYCKIFEYFSDYAKPKAVAHDFIITTTDEDNPESDRKFFNIVKKYDRLVEGFMPSIFEWQNPKEASSYEKAFKQKFSTALEDKTTFLYPRFNSLMLMPKAYFDSVHNIGSVMSAPGYISGNISNYAIDEVYRNHEYLFKYKDAFYPSMAMRVFLLINDNPKIVLTDNSITFPELNYSIKQFKNYFQIFNPIRFYKMYPDGYSHKKYSAGDIMDSYDLIKAGKKPIINPVEFKDKVVVVGAYVPASSSLNDNKNSPIAVQHPGADIQATTIDNILNNDFLTVLPDWVNILLTLLGMSAIFFAIKKLDLLKSATTTAAVLLGYILLGTLCFYYCVIINFLTPIVMFILTTLIAYTYKYVDENRNKEKVQSALGKYMSEKVMKDVVKNIDNLGLGGKKSNVTVLFSDIRGFTSLSEKMTAQEVSELLNEYFTEMEPIITKYNGVINKFIGDAIMAIFGEPIQDENHVQNAVRCGYEMLERVQKLNRKWANNKKPEIEIGIGINTGEVFVGNIGSVNRMEYTVIGDTVNLASRLESYNKVYRTKMLISPAVYKEVKGFTDALKIPDVQIRGKANKMDIYEVLRVIDNQSQ